MTAKLLYALSLGHEGLAPWPDNGSVLAVTSRAVYLAGGARVVALAGQDAPDGPLTIRLPDIEPVLRALHGQNSATFQKQDDLIHFSVPLSISLAGAHAWTPPYPDDSTAPEPVSWWGEIGDMVPREGAQHGAAPLAAHLLDALFSGRDFNPESLPPREGPTARLIGLHLASFYGRLLSGDGSGACQALPGLLGTGPGLTPSGDDVLCGLAASLVWQQRSPLAGDLAAAIEVEAPKRTNRISARLLHYAAKGLLYAPAMSLGCALLSGDRDEGLFAARNLLKIGATTGADIVVGILAGLLVCVRVTGPVYTKL